MADNNHGNISVFVEKRKLLMFKLHSKNIEIMKYIISLLCAD